MNSKKFIELTNKKIDGHLSQKENQLLELHIAEDPEAKKYFLDMTQSMHLLKKVVDVEPSENLKKVVMNSIDKDLYNRKLKRSLRERFSFDFLSGPIPKFAFTFVSGLLVGLVTYSIYTANLQSPLNEKELYGSIGSSNNQTELYVYEMPLTVAEIDGHIYAKESEKSFEIITQINERENIELTIDYDTSVLQFSSYNLTKEAEASLVFEPGQVKLSGSALNEYSLKFIKNSDIVNAVNLELSASSGPVLSRSIVLNENNNKN